jgi:hypothetical protein
MSGRFDPAPPAAIGMGSMLAWFAALGATNAAVVGGLGTAIALVGVCGLVRA